MLYKKREYKTFKAVIHLLFIFIRIENIGV